MKEVKFNIGHLEWHVFHMKVQYVRAQQTRSRTGILPPWSRGTCLFPGGFEDWMSSSMTDLWSRGSSSNTTSCPIYVKSSKDAMLFKLTWSDDAKRLVFPK